MSNNIYFENLPGVDDLSGVIEDVFGVKLDISGGWGYDNNTAVIVNSLAVEIDQFLHMFASMRANVEMNLILEEEQRYGGINVSFEDSKKFEIDNKVYDVVTFKVTAMKEKTYADFIKEYKDNYGKKEFDLSGHFKRREENTISRTVDYWFYGLN